MTTEQKLIENLTAQLELTEKILKQTEDINKTLWDQKGIYESIRLSDDKIIKELEKQILKVKSELDKI